VKLKQRICGFIGHRSKVSAAFINKDPYSIQLKCEKCGYTTKWFRLPSNSESGGE